MPRRPSSASQRFAISPSSMSRGGTGAPPTGRTVSPGSGNARMSTLPAGVSGSDGSQTTAAGSIASGSTRERARRRFAGGGADGSAATSQATICRVSLVAPRSATAAARTSGKLGERRLDLAQLDAMTAQLHLAIGATDEQDRAVVAHARAIAGPVGARVARGVEGMRPNRASSASEAPR